MEKILNNDYRNNIVERLKESGIEEEKAIKFVKEQYHKALKEEAIHRIKQFLDYIENDKYDEAESIMYIYMDGTYLDFSYINSSLWNIYDVIQELKSK